MANPSSLHCTDLQVLPQASLLFLPGIVPATLAVVSQAQHVPDVIGGRRAGVGLADAPHDAITFLRGEVDELRNL